jgi:RNA polymerase sigma-70 factor (ECF subfamily)
MQDQGRVWRERGLQAAVLAGDESAWRVWYDESADAMYAYIAWRCGGLRDAADEIAQDVWLTAVRRLPTFDPAAGSFLGWLRGIAARVSANRFRRDRRREGIPPHRPNHSPDDAVIERERAERVAAVLAALPDNYEAVLRAKYLDTLSVASIAEGMGLSEKAVESLLSRARAAFRELYQPDE